MGNNLPVNVAVCSKNKYMHVINISFRIILEDMLRLMTRYPKVQSKYTKILCYDMHVTALSWSQIDLFLHVQAILKYDMELYCVSKNDQILMYFFCGYSRSNIFKVFYGHF